MKLLTIKTLILAVVFYGIFSILFLTQPAYANIPNITTTITTSTGTTVPGRWVRQTDNVNGVPLCVLSCGCDGDGCWHDRVYEGFPLRAVRYRMTDGYGSAVFVNWPSRQQADRDNDYNTMINPNYDGSTYVRSASISHGDHFFGCGEGPVEFKVINPYNDSGTYTSSDPVGSYSFDNNVGDITLNFTYTLPVPTATPTPIPTATPIPTPTPIPGCSNYAKPSTIWPSSGTYPASNFSGGYFSFKWQDTGALAYQFGIDKTVPGPGSIALYLSPDSSSPYYNPYVKKNNGMIEYAYWSNYSLVSLDYLQWWVRSVGTRNGSTPDLYCIGDLTGGYVTIVAPTPTPTSRPWLKTTGGDVHSNK